MNRYEEDLSLQILPDFYPEHTNLAMNKKRRITVSRLRNFFTESMIDNNKQFFLKINRLQALTKILQLIRQDLDRERRSKQGLDTLANAMHHSASLKHDDSHKNVYEKLHHVSTENFS